jgi:hypothetical protein
MAGCGVPGTFEDTVMEGTLALADRRAWAESQFADAELGDLRRTRRLVTVAAMMAGNSSGSIPQQTGGGADMKAAYRLFSAEGVTHAAVCQPHFELTRQAAASLPLVFLVQDTMVLNFTSHKQCQGLGPIGEGTLRGLHQQNVLAFDPATRRPLGLMYQKHHRRIERPKGSHADRKGRRAIPLEQRESYWWIDAIRAVGSPPPGVRWVHVGDRGEDLFGVYDEAQRQGADWLIRVSQDRRVFTAQGEDRLLSYARRLPKRIERVVTIRRPHAAVPEEVTLCVAGGPVTLRPSRADANYRDRQPIACWVVRVWEASPPAGSQPLEWILCTSLSCQSDEALGFVAQGYAFRWIVEEFHKCQKTGCQVEMRRLEHTDRLEPLIGLLSVLAVWLLQLKFVARDQPQTPARELFDEKMVEVMARYLRHRATTLTAGEFWRGIGRLGGHPGRKGDGPVGWLRAWRGWQSFQLIMLGAHLSSPCGATECG